MTDHGCVCGRARLYDLDLRLYSAEAVMKYQKSSQSNAVCGNARREEEEACDDGNVRANDGCDPECKVESISVATDAACRLRTTMPCSRRDCPLQITPIVRVVVVSLEGCVQHSARMPAAAAAAMRVSRTSQRAAASVEHGDGSCRRGMAGRAGVRVRLDPCGQRLLLQLLCPRPAARHDPCLRLPQSGRCDWEGGFRCAGLGRNGWRPSTLPSLFSSDVLLPSCLLSSPRPPTYPLCIPSEPWSLSLSLSFSLSLSLSWRLAAFEEEGRTLYLSVSRVIVPLAIFVFLFACALLVYLRYP